MPTRRLAGAVAAGIAALLLTSFLSHRHAEGVVEAQQPTRAPGRVLVSTYRVAPGKHVEFLKWQAEREAIAKEAGIGPTQWYAHLNGDSWDYIAIGPATTDQQDQQIDAVTKQKGLSSGFAAGLEIRQFVASHTDTFAQGPMTAAQLVGMAETR